MGKIIGIVVVVAFFIVVFFPHWIPRLLRSLGRVLGDVGRAGREFATGEEERDSPLARYEVQAGRILAARTLASSQSCDDPRVTAFVTDVGKRLSEHAARREIPYAFNVLESDEPNAFAVPGGEIFVTRSLVELCERDTERLAGVLAHEIVHIDRRHALHNLATDALARTGIRLLTLGKTALLGRVADAFQELIVQGYRQDQEFEADLLGAQLARASGYDPRGLARLLGDLQSQRPDDGSPLGEVLQYFGSHPPAAERIARLERHFGA